MHQLLGAGIAQWYSVELRAAQLEVRDGIFLFTTVSRPAPRPTHPPTQRIPGSLSLGVKRPGREADS
jgi:hypothetical protein